MTNLTIVYDKPGTFAAKVHDVRREMASNPDEHYHLHVDLWGTDGERVASLPRWVPLMHLTQLVALLDSAAISNWHVDVSVCLIPSDIVAGILQPDARRPLDRDLVKAVQDRVRFLHGCGFVELLAGRNAQLEPSLSYFEDTARKLQATVRCKHEFSSTMMPISSLIDDPIENGALATRLLNVKNILLNQVYRNESDEKRRAEVASTLFMYELVKNIYQHAFHGVEPRNRVYGYASAQISRYPIAFGARNRHREFADYVSIPEADKLPENELTDVVRYLNITVADFGRGMLTRIRNDLHARGEEIDQIWAQDSGVNACITREDVTRYKSRISRLLELSPPSLLLWAATTTYTSRLLVRDMSKEQLQALMREGPEYSTFKPVPEQIDGSVKGPNSGAADSDGYTEYILLVDEHTGAVARQILLPMGYGLGYCLLFVVRHLGSLTIVSDNVELSFNAREKAFLDFSTGKMGLAEGLAKLRTHPAELLVIRARMVGPLNRDEERVDAYPGTQVTIEIPVWFRWAEQQNKLQDEANREFDELYKRTFFASQVGQQGIA